MLAFEGLFKLQLYTHRHLTAKNGEEELDIVNYSITGDDPMDPSIRGLGSLSDVPIDG